MEVREELAELLKEIPNEKGLRCFDLWDMRAGAEDIADALIDRGVTVQKWIPVTERLPEQDFKVLVYGGNELLYVNGILQPAPCVYTGYLYDIDPEPCFFTWDKPQDVIKNVTHWMPLPLPPKGE